MITALLCSVLELPTGLYSPVFLIGALYGRSFGELMSFMKLPGTQLSAADFAVCSCLFFYSFTHLLIHSTRAQTNKISHLLIHSTRAQTNKIILVLRTRTQALEHTLEHTQVPWHTFRLISITLCLSF